MECKICRSKHVSLIRELYINLRSIDALEVKYNNRKNSNYGENDFVNDILVEDYQSRIVIDNDKPLCVYGVSNTSLNGMH